MKEFPIPVVAVGPGSQFEEEALTYMPMPSGMETFRAPSLPEPGQLAPRHAAMAALRRIRDALATVSRGEPAPQIDLTGLDATDLKLVNQVLGEGEVAARVHDAELPTWLAATPLAEGVSELRVQEAVFAGVWRIVHMVGERVVHDAVEVGMVPEALRAAAAADADGAMPHWNGALPPEVQNAPALLAEIQDHWQDWRDSQPSHVLNLTLLPMSDADIGFLDHHLGTGRVLILSRGYGNCRITNTLRPHCWRVVYYNSQDVVILNTVEIGALPEVALAAPEDLVDSHERLNEVLEWVETA